MIITLTGPRSIGKSTIAPLVAQKLGLRYVSSDAIGEEALKEHGGLDKTIKSGLVKEFIRKNGYSLISQEYQQDSFVFDLSAGSISSTDFEKASQDLRKIAKSKSIVVGLLPYPDEGSSITLLFERERKREHFKDLEQSALQAKVERHYKKIPPLFEIFCDIIVYCEDKTPQEVADEIVEKIKNRN